MRVATLAIAAFAALLPAAVLAHEGTDVVVRGHIHPNGPIEITGEDFAPDDHIRIELRKGGVPPIELGFVAADANGGFGDHLPRTGDGATCALRAGC